MAFIVVVGVVDVIIIAFIVVVGVVIVIVQAIVVVVSGPHTLFGCCLREYIICMVR